jgi:hypothetical protein
MRIASCYLPFAAQWRSPADTIVCKRIRLVHNKEGVEYLPLYRIRIQPGAACEW